MRIGICDDDAVWLTKAKYILEKYYRDKNEELEVLLFKNSQELLPMVHEINFVCMDIELEKENGISVVKTMNKLNPSCFIVYLTNYLYYATDAYETCHDYYVLKSQFEEKLDVIHEIYERNKKHYQDRIQLITTEKEVVGLPVSEIIYVERSDRKTFITTKHQIYIIKDKLELMEERLKSHQFIRSHKSFLVNPHFVKEMKKDRFLLLDDQIIPISQRHVRNSRMQFLDWSTKHMI